jgi:iron complex transport system substrate-binding protein
VCAVDVSVVGDALAHLGCTADVLTIDPYTLDEVFESFLTLGRATGRLGAATALVDSQRARLDAVRSRVAGLPRPRVMLLEWTDPPYAPGHWMPEMIDAAGGEPLLGTPGARSERVTWEAVRAARPDLVVAAPCGFDLAGATELAAGLEASGVLPPGVPVHAVDANAAWARPGTRVVDGVEELAALLHPAPPIP